MSLDLSNQYFLFVCFRSIEESGQSNSSSNVPDDSRPLFVTLKRQPENWDGLSFKTACINMAEDPSFIYTLFNPLAHHRTVITSLCTTENDIWFDNTKSEGSGIFELQVNPSVHLSSAVKSDPTGTPTAEGHEFLIRLDMRPLEIRSFHVRKGPSNGSKNNLKPNHARTWSDGGASNNKPQLMPKNTKDEQLDTKFSEGDKQSLGETFSINNCWWELHFNPKTGFPYKITNKNANVTELLAIDLLSYDPVEGQSGAYLMKFVNQDKPEKILKELGKPTVVKTSGALASSVRVTYGGFFVAMFELFQAPDLQTALHMQVCTIDI